MENQQFDEVVKQLTLTRLSRLGALRGLAVSALTGVVGAGMLNADTEAKKGKKGKGKDKGKGKGKGKSHKNNDGKGQAKGEHWGWPHGPGKRVEICHCQTLTLSEKAAQAHLKQHPTDRMGSCAAQTTTTTTTARPTTTTTTTTTAPPTTTTTTTAPPCVPRTGACDWASTCCNELDVCGTEGASAGKCCGGWQAPCSTTADCCPCYENDINRCICATSLGYCIMTEIG